MGVVFPVAIGGPPSGCVVVGLTYLVTYLLGKPYVTINVTKFAVKNGSIGARQARPGCQF
jgi:hypothetical protein